MGDTMRCQLDGGSCVACGQCRDDEEIEQQDVEVDEDLDDPVQDHPGGLIGAFEG